MKGHHIEALAVRIFRKYPSLASRTDEALLEYYYKHAKKEVRHPIKDVTKQSRYADEYAGNANSIKRQKMATNLEKNHSVIKSARKTGDTSELKKSLDGDSENE